ncbi:hypothetical protein [Escherichia fergusonii]|uniref:hypothetical protein n=1 Tax=Escherichia fergusonii TaxID=564 RepID=UPI0021CA7040|nr:hypothetical protein [Escherichia fergusonii]
MSNQWRPDICPITGRVFFMWIEHPTLGNVPTYGGPLDSYTNKMDIAVLEIALVSLAAEPAGKLHEYKPVGYQRLVDELTMQVKQLAWQLRKAKPDCKLPDKAMSYLERNGLISVEDVLR